MNIRGRSLRTLGLLIAVAVALSSGVASAQVIPSDPQPTCVVSPTNFAKWFASGTVTKNGLVKPANSITFNPNSNCSFYQWSDQMYLWATSPAPSIYGSGAHVFDSAIFYDVSAEVNHKRFFIKHPQGPFIRNLALRAAQVGPHRLPLIFDKRGVAFEIEPTPVSPAGKPLVLDNTGKQVEAHKITVANGKATFLSKAGTAIPAARPALKLTAAAPRIAQKFMVGTTPVFVTQSGTVVDVEVGQAGGNGVLISQNGALIYYASMVNDVYAFFLTGATNGAITPGTAFPTTQAQATAVVNYAKAHGTIIPDPEALAIELKTSWIEASSVPDPQNYISMKATIPTFIKSSTTLWTPGPAKTTVLVMVGMHVVGSVAGHPEMIWATWEHPGNAPNATYSYNSTSGLKTVNLSTAGTWLFAATNTTGPFNVVRQSTTPPSGSTTGGNIIAANPAPPPPTPGTIGPNNAQRYKPWGASSNVSPNGGDASAAASNTEIISINNSVRGQLIAGDPRFNYFMTGSTWTINGAAPTGAFNSAAGSGGGNEVGTSQLANVTMETFQQGLGSPWNVQTNCFFCHANANPFPAPVTTSVSHIYSQLQPLFH